MTEALFSTSAGLSVTRGRARRESDRTVSSWTLTLLAATILLAPLVYGLVAFHGAWAEMGKPQVAEHIAYNTFANVAVMASTVWLNGRMDQRLSGLFSRTLIVHGALAFLTLVTRHYYSSPMLVTGVALSAALGSLVVLIQQRAWRRQVAVLGPWLPILDDPALGCEPLASPTAAIGDYDLLLLTFEGEPPAPYASTLTRALLAGKRVRHIAEFMEESHGVASIEHFDLDHLPKGGLTTYRSAKRALDILAAAVLAPFALPVLAVAAAGIWFTMGSPVLFTQTRVGQGGRLFRILKLRTMRPDAGEGGGVATAVGDSRITPLGAWLRRLHIDELPQLWNVLVGDMSLVGPRPEQPGLTADYVRHVPAFAYRQLVRPGITGWAQVRAGYAADLAETRIKLGYDLFYLKNFSFGLDVQIYARTLGTLLTGGGVR